MFYPAGLNEASASRNCSWAESGVCSRWRNCSGSHVEPVISKCSCELNHTEVSYTKRINKNPGVYTVLCFSNTLSIIHYRCVCVCVCKDGCGVIPHSHRVGHVVGVHVERESRIVPRAVRFISFLATAHTLYTPDVKYIRPVGSYFLSSPPSHLPVSLPLPPPSSLDFKCSQLPPLNKYLCIYSFTVIMHEKLVVLPQHDFSTKSPNRCRNHSLNYNWLANL